MEASMLTIVPVSTDPVVLVKELDLTVATPDAEAARRFEQLLRQFLVEAGIDDADDAHHLRETRGGMTLEDAARRSGWVMGFEYARALGALR
jgi:hypothetical protein